MPTSSFDTFFACTIIVAAALIATGFLCSTMQVRIDNTKKMNEQSYLQAIANHIVTNPGAPVNWGTSSSVPTDFGLAAGSSTIPYALDIDKITKLNILNNYSLSYFDIENSAKLNMALGIAISQIMKITVEESGNSTANNYTSFTLSISTSVDSQPASAGLNCYVAADNYMSNVTGSTSAAGSGSVVVQVPTAATGNALVIIFGRASFDERITSYAVFNLANATQEMGLTSGFLNSSPLNQTLSFTNTSGLVIQNCYLFSYAYQRNLAYTASHTQFAIPGTVDKSPLIMLVDGVENGTYFQEWVPYPEVPFKAGSNFSGSGQNVFDYTVTINGVLYKLEISLGGSDS